MYHILASAFMLMEDERDTFQSDLDRVESHYKHLHETRRDAGSVRLIVSLNAAFLKKTLRASFAHWCTSTLLHASSLSHKASLQSLQKHSLTVTCRSILSRVINRLLKRVLLAWNDSSKANKYARLLAEFSDYRTAMDSKCSVLSNDVKSLVAERTSLQSQLALLKTKKNEDSMKKAHKFISMWQNRLLTSTYQSWITYTGHRKKFNQSMKLFVVRWSKSVLYKMVCNWKEWVKDEKTNRVTLRKYLGKINELSLSRGFNGWLSFVSRRCLARRVINRMINKTIHSGLLSGFTSWLDYVKYLKHEDVLRDTVNSRLESGTESMRNEMNDKILKEKNRKRDLSLKIIQSVINAALSNTLKSWMAFTARVKSDRVLLERFSKKWRYMNVINAFNSWYEYLSRRRFLRVTLNRITMQASIKGVRHFFKIWSNKVLLFSQATIEQQLDAAKQSLLLAVSREEDLKHELSALRASNELIHSNLSTTQKNLQQDKLKRAHKLIQVWSNSTLTKTFSNWKEYTRVSRRLRTAVARSLLKAANKTLFNIVSAWYNHTKQVKKDKLSIIRFQARYNNLTMFKGFNSWLGYVSERKRLKRLCNKLFFSLDTKALSSAWRSWRDFVAHLTDTQQRDADTAANAAVMKAEQARKMALSKKIIQSIVNGCLLLHFNMWTNHVVEVKRQRVVVSRFVNRLKNGAVVSCFNSWVFAVKTRFRLRALLNRCFGDKSKKMLGRGFVTWHRNIHLLTNAEAGLRMKQLEESNAALLEELDKLKAVQAMTENRLTESERMKREKGLENAKKLINILSNKLLLDTLTAWVKFTKESVRGKAVTTRFMTRLLRAKVYKAFNCWRTEVAEEVRRDGIVTKFAYKLRNGTLVRCFNFWKDSVRTRIRYRIVVERFRKRLCNVTLGKAWRGIVSYVDERKRLKKIVLRFLNQIDRKFVAAAWRSWMIYSTNKKEYELLGDYERLKVDRREEQLRRNTSLVLTSLQRFINTSLSASFVKWKNMVEQEKKDLIVISRFVKRWTHQSQMRCFISWIDYVVSRRELRSFVRRMIGGKEYNEKEYVFRLWCSMLDEIKEYERKMEIESMRRSVNSLQIESDKLKHEAELKIAKAREAGERIARNMFAVKLKGWLCTTFLAWRDDTRQIVSDRRRLKVIIARVVNKKLSAGFRTWYKNIAASVRNILGEKENDSVVLSRQLHLLHTEHKAIKERRIRQVLGFIVMKDLGQAFRFWYDEVQEHIRHEVLCKKIVNRIVNGVLVRIITSWYSYTKTEKRHRVIITRFKSRMQLGVAAKAWGTWKEWFVNVRRNKVIVTRFQRRMLNTAVMRAVNSWVEYTRVRKRMRELTRRIFMRLNSDGLYKGFVTWSTYIHQIKKEEYVINLFVKRWRSLQSYKVFKAWVGFVEDRRFSDDNVIIGSEKNESNSTALDAFEDGNGSNINNNSSNSTNTTSKINDDTAFVLSSSGGTGKKMHHKIRSQSSFGSAADMKSSNSVKSGVSMLANDIALRSSLSSLAANPDTWSTPVVASLDMTPTDNQLLSMHTFNAKKVLFRARFVQNNLQMEQFMQTDRVLVTQHIRSAVREMKMKDFSGMRKLIKSIFRQRGFDGIEMAFKSLVLGVEINKQEKKETLTRFWLITEKLAKTSLQRAFSKICLFTWVRRFETIEEEHALATKRRLQIHADQMSKAREESMRVGRSVLNKLTQSRRTNLLEIAFNGLKNARELRIRGVALVKRWIMKSQNGELMWAFQNWKSKSNAAEAYAQRAAFLNAADAENRAKLGFILNRFWDKKDVGAFGAPGNERNDRRRAFLRWKHKMVREKQKDACFEEVDFVSKMCGNLLAQLARESATAGSLEENSEVYLRVKSCIDDVCNMGGSGGLGSWLVGEEKKADDDGEDSIIRGCLVLCDSAAGGAGRATGRNMFCYVDGELKRMPRMCGVVGDVIEEGGFASVTSLLKDPRYDPLVDEVVLAACGRPMMPVERNAVERFQTLAMKSSNAMSRIAASRSTSGRMRSRGDGSVVVGMVGQIPGLNPMASAASGRAAKIPDVGMMVLPLGGGGRGGVVGACVVIGRSSLLEEGVARNLGVVGGGVYGFLGGAGGR
jgi:hypothetical protein